MCDQPFPLESHGDDVGPSGRPVGLVLYRFTDEGGGAPVAPQASG